MYMHLVAEGYPLAKHHDSLRVLPVLCDAEYHHILSRCIIAVVQGHATAPQGIVNVIILDI